MDDREERIRAKAYELWEQAGRPEGQQAEHWAAAERLINPEPGVKEGPGVNPDQRQNSETQERKVMIRRKRKESVKPVKASHQ